jgi:Tfp pilus assembly protein PilF
VYYERVGETQRAEQIYSETLREPASAGSTRERLARMLKAQKRYADATQHWQALADSDSLDALIELAKHYEWRERDIPQALANALRASAICTDAAVTNDLAKRIARLQRKLE